MIKKSMIKKSTLAAAIALTLSTGVAQAVPWTGTFIAYSSGGFAFAPDMTVTGEELLTLESTTPFFGYTWVVKNLQTYTSTFTVDTIEGGVYSNIQVGLGQIGGSMLFDWGSDNTTTTCGKASCNVDVIQVWDVFDGYGGVASYVSTDIYGSGIRGAATIEGAFAGYYFNFDMIPPVPVPPAVWLFGSGLLGLFGIAKRKRKARA